MKILILLALLCSLPVQADNLMIRSGTGISNTRTSRIFALTFEKSLRDNWHYRAGGGFWIDNRPNKNSTYYGEFLIGKQAGDFDGFHLALDVGFLWMTATDDLLGSHYQLTEELTIGYKSIDFTYKHISNAGIIRPNIGRDYILLNLRIF